MNKQGTTVLLLFRKGKVGQFSVITKHQIDSACKQQYNWETRSRKTFNYILIKTCKY